MNIQIVEHHDVPEKTILDICNLKDESWPYGIAKQRLWLKDNLADDDLHVLAYDEGNDLIAYLNIVYRLMIWDGKQTEQALCIGNVCVSSRFRGKGLGNQLMQFVNAYIQKMNGKGLLLCKDALVPFYHQNNWQIVLQSTVKSEFDLAGIHVMCYNFNPVEITLAGKAF